MPKGLQLYVRNKRADEISVKTEVIVRPVFTLTVILTQVVTFANVLSAQLRVFLV